MAWLAVQRVVIANELGIRQPLEIRIGFLKAEAASAMRAEDTGKRDKAR